MKINVVEISKRLLKISEMIDTEFDILSKLSYAGRESTAQFDDYINDIANNMNEEKRILDGLDFDALGEISRFLMEKFDSSDFACGRLIDNIDERIVSMPKPHDSEEEYDEEDEYADEEDSEIDPETDILLDDVIEYYQSEEKKPKKNNTEAFSIDGYYIEEFGYEHEATKATDYIATIVIKNMVNRIKSTLADTRQDRMFKRDMLKEFRSFKYFYFTFNNTLENIGVKARFNVDNVPYLKPVDFDISAIAYNECVTFLDKLYFVETDETDLYKLSLTLYHMMSFEEYLKYLTSKSIDVLIHLSQQLAIIGNNPLYGELAYKKLLKRKKEIEKLGRDS